jgi:hypothetical protein
MVLGGAGAGVCEYGAVLAFVHNIRDIAHPIFTYVHYRLSIHISQ